MTTPRYQTGSRYAATATALLILLPQAGDLSQTAIEPTTATGYQALGEVGAQIAQAITPSAYSATSSESLSSFLLEVAAKLLSQSKALDADFSAVVDREFWNLI